VTPRVEALLQRVQAIAERRFDVTAEKVIQELAAIAFANARDYYEWGIDLRPRIGKGGELVIDPAHRGAEGRPRPLRTGEAERLAHEGADGGDHRLRGDHQQDGREIDLRAHGGQEGGAA
jgi:hypothetical protein